MASSLTVALVQADLIWENPSANYLMFDGMLEKLPPGVDIVVLPEMFNTGFSMHPQPLAAASTTTAPSWMLGWAQRLNAAIVGSVMYLEDGLFYNRLLWVEPSGQMLHYNKRHCFTLVGEHEVFRSGSERLLIDYRGWKIMPFICYDLRFPVWSRNTLRYDLLIYVANFPKPRSHAWRTLLMARAIENVSYTVGVNRVGTDGTGAEYAGESCVADYAGQVLVQLSSAAQVSVQTLDKNLQDSFRQRFDFLSDRDAFELIH